MKLYRICWRDKLSDASHQFKGIFSEADKDIWLKHLSREDGPAGYEYWAEPVLSEGEGEVKGETGIDRINEV